jgi:hypothetical protein
MTGAAMSKRMRPEYYGKFTGRKGGREAISGCSIFWVI